MKPVVLRCPKCQLLNWGSTFREAQRAKTQVAVSVFWENGKQHIHDPNVETTVYECTRGHRWEVIAKDSCWCRWPRVRSAAPPPVQPPPPVVSTDVTFVPAAVIVEPVVRRSGFVELEDKPLTRKERKALRRAADVKIEESSDGEQKDA